MPVIPSRFPGRFGDVFPMGCFVRERRQKRDRETNLVGWTVRALDANGEVARFGAECKVKVAAVVPPAPPAKTNGLPYPAVEFEGLAITPYAGCNGRVAYRFRAAGLRVLTVGRSGKAGEPGESASKSAAA